MRNIVILGGGTAGWMAAILMITRWAEKDIGITLVESPDIGIIGVGEGSTPQLKAFFDQIGLDESEWMPACNATYKLGIKFEGWSTNPGFEDYFHPFPATADSHTVRAFIRNCYERRKGFDVPSHPDDYFLNTQLTANKLGPEPDYSFPLPVQYGYHFDSSLLGKLLASLAVKRGVVHHQATVTSVRRQENGDIAALVTADGVEIEGDMFIDSTGFAGLLMQKTLGVAFKGFQDNLFNDAAVVMPTPAEKTITPQTVSTAMSAGWRWHIPLTNRVGNGYVYSSAYLSADEAETELRSALGLLDSDVEARHLGMQVGQLEQHWSHNCLAVGLTQGFIEPLEATALHLVHVTIDSFMEDYERGEFSNRHQQEFNTRIGARFEGVRDYIVCHYRVNTRTDTQYWRDNAANEHLSTSLRQLLHTWLQREDLTLELQQQDIEKYYTTLSWHCLLAGYGIFPEANTLREQTSGAGEKARVETREFIQRCSTNFAPLMANILSGQSH